MFNSPKLSLSDLLGRDYTEAIARANDFLGFMSYEKTMAVADEKIDFYPEAKQKRNDELLCKVGTQIIEPMNSSAEGAATAAFNDSSFPSIGIFIYCFALSLDKQHLSPIIVSSL